MLEKVKKIGSKISCLCAAVVVSAQNAVAASVVDLPADAKTDLSDTVTENFPTIIGVIVIIIACGLLIKLLRKL